MEPITTHHDPRFTRYFLELDFVQMLLGNKNINFCRIFAKKGEMTGTELFVKILAFGKFMNESIFGHHSVRCAVRTNKFG